MFSLAQWQQFLELQVIQQGTAQRLDGQHMHRKRHTGRVAGRGVVIAVAAEHGHLPLGEKLCGPRVEAGAGLRDVPRSQFVAPLAVTDTHEEHVALAHPYVLFLFGRDQLLGGHVITWLEPRHAA